MGVGYSSYSGGIGNKGFFYAGNELSAMYLVINSYLLLNVWDNNYVITAFGSDGLVLYHNHIGTERQDEALYFVVACADAYLDYIPKIVIECDFPEFEKLEEFFSKYYKDVHHLYESIKTLVPGLVQDKVIDFNCACLLEYIKGTK